MNDSDQIQSLKALTEVARERERPSRGVRLASVRVSPGSYLAAASVLTFCSALLLRSEKDLWALGTLAFAWLFIPILALTDRIEFDGQFLSRRGPIPFLLQKIGRKKELGIADFEKVDSQAVRTLRRGGRVRYRYRTQIVGKNQEFAFASGGRSYREMIQLLFPLVHPDKLDVRTTELREYLCEPRQLNAEVKALQVASADILDGATFDFKLGGKKQDPTATVAANAGSTPDTARAKQLGQLANRLRIAGRLNEAREAFRRALTVLPQDGRLIFQFARLLRSQASSLGDVKLSSRSRAALRLSARRSERDPELLALVGESFLEWGETLRARDSFQRVIESEPRNFRARLGLANLALREGKLAHVINQYRHAAGSATDKALSLYAGREADYYAQLNDDDDYLVSELRRINWLQHSLKVRRLAARVTNASILLALIVPYVDDTVANLCWYLATSSLIAWISSLIAIKSLAKRRSPRLAN